MSKQIKNFHAHVYFTDAQFEQGEVLCLKAGELFGVKVGRFHRKPVGPHPVGMCQLTIENDDFAKVIPWLALNRDGLSIFVHPDTGEHLKDHTAHAIWMGEQLVLDTSIF